MTPNSVLEKAAKRRKYERVLRDKGDTGLMVEVAVTLDQLDEKVSKNAEATATHAACPVHKAHPWTRDSFLFVLAGILGIVGVAAMVSGQVPGVGG